MIEGEAEPILEGFYAFSQPSIHNFLDDVAVEEESDSIWQQPTYFQQWLICYSVYEWNPKTILFYQETLANIFLDLAIRINYQNFNTEAKHRENVYNEREKVMDSFGGGGRVKPSFFDAHYL